MLCLFTLQSPPIGDFASIFTQCHVHFEDGAESLDADFTNVLRYNEHTVVEGVFLVVVGFFTQVMFLFLWR